MSLLPPDIKSGRKLNAGELNKVNFANRHTILTPEHLAQLRQISPDKPNMTNI